MTCRTCPLLAQAAARAYFACRDWPTAWASAFAAMRPRRRRSRR